MIIFYCGKSPKEADLLQQKAWTVGPTILTNSDKKDIPVLLVWGMSLILAGKPLIMRGVPEKNISLTSRTYYLFCLYRHQSKESQEAWRSYRRSAVSLPRLFQFRRYIQRN